MKRLQAVILALFIIISLTACVPDGTTDTPELSEIYKMAEKGYTTEQIKEKLSGRYFEDIYVSWGYPDSVADNLWVDIWLLNDSGECIAVYYNAEGNVHDVLLADSAEDIDSYEELEDRIDITHYMPAIKHPEKLYFLKEKYVDISSLPVLDMDIKKEYSFDDRTIYLEDSIDNEIEYIMYKFFCYEMRQDFAARQAMTGYNENFSVAIKNEERAVEEGWYIYNRIIHSIEILPAETVTAVSNSDKNNILEIIKNEDITEYAVVKVDTTWRHNPETELVSQVDDGRYFRYYLIVKPLDSADYKICNVYWYFEE